MKKNILFFVLLFIVKLFSFADHKNNYFTFNTFDFIANRFLVTFLTF